jgi:hypothetical protein
MDSLRSLQRDPALASLSMNTLSTFIRLASLLKRDILLPQPPSQPSDSAPDVLPRSIATFLANAICVPISSIGPCWDALKDDVWSLPPPQGLVSQEDEEMFKMYGWKLGLSEYPHLMYPFV